MGSSSSSSNRPKPPPAGEPGSPVVFIDWGPALPDSYGRPRILALVRDPRCFFACWEDGDLIRARDLTDGSVQEHGVGRVGSWYFEGIPEHEYEVELLSGGQRVALSERLRLNADRRIHLRHRLQPDGVDGGRNGCDHLYLFPRCRAAQSLSAIRRPSILCSSIGI